MSERMQTLPLFPAENVYPDLDGVGGQATLISIVGALLTVVLILAVLMLIVSAIVWAVSSAHGNFQNSAKSKAGVLVAVGTAALAGAGVAWMNFLLGVGETL